MATPDPDATAERSLLDRSLLVLQLLCYGTIVLAIGAQIVCRHFFDSPLAFPEEVSVLLLVTAAYFGLVGVERHNEHIRVETLRQRLGPRARRGVEILAKLLGLAFVAALLLGEAQLLPGARHLKTPAAGIPMVLLHGAVILACLLWAAVQLFGIARLLRGGRAP